MNCEPLLIEQVYPAVLARSKPSVLPGDVLRSMLLVVARQMAAARGLDCSLLPDPGQWALPDLQDINFSQADITLLGNVYTTLLSGRHRRGSYYTPQALAEITARKVLTPDASAWRILDPAMGSGHLLLAAARVIAGRIDLPDEHQARWQALSRLYGVDNDPTAVELAAITLWLWAACPGTSPSMLRGRLVCADSLLDDQPWHGELVPPFDAVIGNPPYASAITRARTPHLAHRLALQARYHTARGSFDLSVPFVERAITLCCEGGRCGLVLPNKLLAADYARSLRSWLGQQVTVEAIIDASQERSFAANVYPVVLVFCNTSPSPDSIGRSSECLVEADPGKRARTPASTAKAKPHSLAIYQWEDNQRLQVVRFATQPDLCTTPGQSWSCVLDPDWDVLRRCWQHAIPLGKIAMLVSGLAVGEAYSLRPAVFEAPDGDLSENTFRLLTSRLIRRFDNAWGQTPAAYLKTTYQRPAVMADALPPRRREQASARKIVIAGMGKTPRALVDEGRAQASVSTTIITCAAWPLDALCAILNSQLVGRLCQAIFGGLALSGGHMRFGKPELACLPLPAVDAHDPRLIQLDTLSRQRASPAAAHLAQNIEEKIDALIYTLYSTEC